MDTNQFLQRTKEFVHYDGYSFRKVGPRMLLADGNTISVQASHTHYCSPREDDAEFYFCLEVGYPSFDLPRTWNEYRDGDSHVWGYVPVKMIDKIIQKHGGIVGTQTYLRGEDGKAIEINNRFEDAS